MANILYRGSAAPTTVNNDGAKNAPLTNLEIDRNLFALDRDKFDRVLGGTITGNATFAASSTVTIDGNLIVNGTTTTINSTTLTVDDINVVLGDIASPTNISANGGGITLRGTTDKTFNWSNSTGAWTSSEHLALAAGRNILLNGSSSGTITFAAPAAAGTNTITLPSATGTVALTSDIGNGSITITTGSGLTGSGSFTTNQFGATTVTLSHADTSSVADLAGSNNTFIVSQSYDTFGHVLSRQTGTVDFTVSANFAFQNFAIGLDSGYSWGGANSNTTQSADSSSDTLTFVKGGGINLYTNTSGTDAILIEHSDTSSVGNFNVDNSGGTIIQDIALTFDTYGHVTGISAASLDGDARWVNVTGDTMTGRLVISAGTDGGIAFPNDSFSGSGDIASITLENPAGGEATRMTFRIGNDSDDLFNFIAPSNNGLLMNGNTVWHSGNDGSGSGLDADLLDGLQLHTGRNNEANKVVRTDENGYLQVGYINSSSGNENNNSSPDRVWGSNSSDGYLRTYRTSALNVNYAASAGSAPASDVYSWAKAASKPSYNFSEIGSSTISATSATFTGDITIGSGQNSSSINMSDADEGTRIIHCNSNRIGFLTQAGGWGAYCEDDGSWVSVQNVTAYSDISLKENIASIDSALDKTLKLRGVYYTRKDTEDKTRKVGVIAQEVLEILPEVVKASKAEDKTILSVDYGNITALLIEAIKELNAKVEDLQNQLANK